MIILSNNYSINIYYLIKKWNFKNRIKMNLIIKNINKNKCMNKIKECITLPCNNR